MNRLSYIFFTAEKFIKKIIAITETLRSGSLSFRQLMGINFDAGDKLCNDPTGYSDWSLANVNISLEQRECALFPKSF